MTRILCLWLPNWPIQRLVRSRPALREQAIVLAAAGPRGSRVAACCSTAAAQGIRPGMPLAEAKSLLRALVVERAEPAADRQALAKLAEACERFSPCVAIEEGDAPESLLLDISNLEHLLGTDAELAAKMEQFFTDQRYQVQIAAADTVGLAWAAAHFGKKRNGKLLPSSPSLMKSVLPVEALRISGETAALLREVGLETVGQLLSLPRASLSSRFGERPLQRLDQLTGAAPEVLVPLRPRAALEADWTLEHPTADCTVLMRVLTELATQLARRLAVRDQGAILLVCVLRYINGQSVPLKIGLVQPSADARQIVELIHLHLETLALTDEVIHVELRAAVVGRLGERQGELFADRWPSDPHPLAVLLNRLSSRLGDEQVVRPQLRASPLPERAFRYVPITGTPRVKSRESRIRVPARNAQLSTSDPPARPLLLYPEPRPVEVIGVAVDGPPQFVWLNERRERIVQHRGPERIETLWWRGPSVRRDYYRIATEAGSQLWIYRRLSDGRWFLHGIFA